jgi:E3 ubiquitin-protein ligase TRIP12
MHAAANCCRNASPDAFKTVKEVLPIIRGVLSYPDQRLVESAALCIIRLIESYHRQPDLLDELLTLNDKALLRAINTLLLPPGGSPLISTGTYTLFLRALSSAARSSTKTAVALLEADISLTIYQILTGVLPPSEPAASNNDVQGLEGIADMVVMQSLAHRPKEQVEEALSLVTELMPPLSKGKTPASLPSSSCY